jgi:hypothetical protein
MEETNKKETTAKGMFKEMNAHKMIIQGKDGNWRLNTGQPEDDETEPV